jgi:DNA invertase Pin-like site-specific DNA recombinase
MNENLFKNGIIYCRVSSTEQVDGTSLESQEKVCREFCAREHIQVLKVFVEKGESAKTAERTEFINAISFCSEKKNAVDYFVVYKLDRFARCQADHITVRQTLKKYHTELKSVTEPINDSPVGKMMEGILSAFAEFDNNVRTERSVNGMKERIKQGIWVWQAPMGYCRTEKGANLTPHPTYAPFIKTIFEEYAKGIHTFDSLAKYVTDRGFTMKNGKPAIPQLIEKIIRNPLYCGRIKVWDIEIKGKFEPIVSEHLFDQCQESGKRRPKTPRLAKNSDFPLRKMAVCEFCDKPLTGSKATGRQGQKYPYYHHHKQNCEHAAFVPKAHFEQMFVEYLQEITPSFKFEESFKAIVLDIWKNNFKKFDEENEQIKKAVTVLEQKRQRVFDLHQDKTYTDQEFKDQKSLLDDKIKKHMSLMHEKYDKEFKMDAALEYCFDFVRNTASTWVKLAKKPEDRLCFQKMVISENVQFSGNKFGNAKLTPIYNLYQQFLLDKSQLVTLPGVEPGLQP